MARPDASQCGRREPNLMLQAPTPTTPDGVRAEHGRLRDQLDRLRAENDRLRAENDRLRADNDRLLAENRNVRATLEAHIRRGGSAALYGPLELTARTCVGPPRRRRETSRAGRHP
jgi:hypothetical protein